jgi:ABC-type glycerol-3-phosphate transport system permease component
VSTGLLRAGRVVLLGVLVVFSLAPFQWMLVASLKPGDEQLISGNPWWTASPDWANYARLLEQGSSFRYWAAITLATRLMTSVAMRTTSVLAAQ